jgi:hypothetical protein
VGRDLEFVASQRLRCFLHSTQTAVYDIAAAETSSGQGHGRLSQFSGWKNLVYNTILGVGSTALSHKILTFSGYERVCLSKSAAEGSEARRGSG